MMPWGTMSQMSLRRDFVLLAIKSECSFSELCRRFGVSRKTGYKWLERYKGEGEAGLADRSRRPRRSPNETSKDMVEAILEMRDEHPAWGGRKISCVLKNRGHQGVPQPSTISGILLRHGRIKEEASQNATSFCRFERETPNDLWQMDFKGHFALANGCRCHPLTILDDYSRFSIAVRALANEREKVVKPELINVFRHYGLPYCMLMDNGAPWGSAGAGTLTAFEVWLMELGIRVIHSRPRHPQTNGKDERFHRTMKAELLQGTVFNNLSDSQRKIDSFRDCYNHVRPHEALGLDVPASRYKASPRSYPEKVPEWDYAPDVAVRRVDSSSRISWQNRRIRVGKALRGKRVGLRPTANEDVYEVIFRNTTIKTIEMSEAE